MQLFTIPFLVGWGLSMTTGAGRSRVWSFLHGKDTFMKSLAYPKVKKCNLICDWGCKLDLFRVETIFLPYYIIIFQGFSEFKTTSLKIKHSL